jgi:hypothetical protein
MASATVAGATAAEYGCTGMAIRATTLLAAL